MARLPKSKLFGAFEEAVRLCGWNILFLSNKTAHPARYRVSHDAISNRVKLYIWNITPGGNNRPDDEYRIQITGVRKFSPEKNARNLVLGWSDDFEVFAGWDIRLHRKALGNSPSFQINEKALLQARLAGFAPYVKANGEMAIAFRPDFISTYIEFLESLHDSGKIPAEAAVLTRLSEDAEDVDEEEIDDEVAEKRKRALVSTWRSVRSNNFSRRVLTAYSRRCAMCDVQLRLIDSAHILPVDQPDSTDQTSNGVALCALHHRAYDRGLVTFDSAFKIRVNEGMVKVLKEADETGGLPAFRKALRTVMHTPPDKKDLPATKYVVKANILRGWKS